MAWMGCPLFLPHRVIPPSPLGSFSLASRGTPSRFRSIKTAGGKKTVETRMNGIQYEVHKKGHHNNAGQTK